MTLTKFFLDLRRPDDYLGMNVHSGAFMKQLDKRDHILRAARDFIADHGFHGAPMAKIADRAGVGAGTIYRYFENKDDLIVELYRDLEVRMSPSLLDGYPHGETVKNRFLHICGGVLRYFIDNPADFRFLKQFHNSPYGMQIRQGWLIGEQQGDRLLRELFEEGVSLGAMKALPLPILFALAFSPLLAIARDHILGLQRLTDELFTGSIEACWNSIERND